MSIDWATATGQVPPQADLVAGTIAKGNVSNPPVPTSSGALNANGATPALPTLAKGVLRLAVAITAVAGAGTGTFQVQTSSDAGVTDAWRNVGAATAALAAVGTTHLTVAGLDRYTRVSYTIGGGGGANTITFTLTGELV